MQTKAPHTIGDDYSRDDIREQYDADRTDDVFYLQHAGEQVVALCLCQDLNHRAPEEVWVGAGPRVQYWGDRLAVPGLTIPVYMKPTAAARAFTYFGQYKVTDRIHKPEELEAAMARPGIGKLSRIVFLQKV